jgi:hypothetical protein
MANNGNIIRIPALAHECITNDALRERLTHYVCNDNHIHNLLRNRGAAISIPSCVRECLTLDCRAHPHNANDSMSNYRRKIGRSLNRHYGKPRRERIRVVPARKGGVPAIRPGTPEEAYHVPWHEYDAIVNSN